MSDFINLAKRKNRSMEFPLNESLEQELKQLGKKTRHKKESDKLLCIRMLSKRMSQEDISDYLSIDPRTIYRWKQSFLSSSSISDFLLSASGGSKSNLSASQKKN